MNLVKGTGLIIAVKPDGTGMQTIVPVAAGYEPNDLVFERTRRLLLHRFPGHLNRTERRRLLGLADFKTITPVLPRVAMANGIALSPDGKQFWITEFRRNLLHRVELAGPTTIAPIGTEFPHRFIGSAPDSMRADSDGNRSFMPRCSRRRFRSTRISDVLRMSMHPYAV